MDRLDPPSIVVVIPTYNERENLAALVSRVLQFEEVRVLVVDDDSPDGTGTLADALAVEHPRVSVLHRSTPRGLGPAYLAGFRLALSTGAEIVCQMDADGSHDPADLRPLVAALQNADVALGSRYIAGSNVHDWPTSRRILSLAGNAYVRLVTGLRVRDVTAGFRAWRRNALLRMPLDQIRSLGHGFQVEMTQAATRLHLRIAEVPISFRDRRSGVSKVSARIVLESLVSPWLIAGGAVRAPEASDKARD